MFKILLNCHFMDDEICQHIAQQTNLYVQQKV